MKVEIVGSMLHRPQVLFLDEPTIGLDVTMQKRIREFVAEYRRRHEATVMLTSHYMADVEALCERVIASITAGSPTEISRPSPTPSPRGRPSPSCSRTAPATSRRTAR